MKKNNKKGFTLVELVIVVAVMAVLVAVAIPTVSSIVGTAEKNVAETNAQTIESMLKLAVANGKTLESDEAIAKELVAAKLGITKGSFYYNADTGAVATTNSGDDYKISFTATQVTVGEATLNLDGSEVEAEDPKVTPDEDPEVTPDA